MILIDANLLLYAYNPASHRHSAALRWLEKTLSSPEQVRFAWMTLLAFLRITTHPRAFPNPLSIEESLSIVGAWLDQPVVGTLEPTERHWTILRGLLPPAQARGPLVMDAHLAALAMEHGAVLHTTDRDFSRFEGLRTANPLS